MFSIQENMYIFFNSFDHHYYTTIVASKMNVFKRLLYASEYLKCDQSGNECESPKISSRVNVH